MLKKQNQQIKTLTTFLVWFPNRKLFSIFHLHFFPILYNISVCATIKTFKRKQTAPKKEKKRKETAPSIFSLFLIFFLLHFFTNCKIWKLYCCFLSLVKAKIAYQLHWHSVSVTALALKKTLKLCSSAFSFSFTKGETMHYLQSKNVISCAFDPTNVLQYIFLFLTIMCCHRRIILSPLSPQYRRQAIPYSVVKILPRASQELVDFEEHPY